LTEKRDTCARADGDRTRSANWLALDRVLELLAAFTIVTSLIGLAAALAGVFHAPQVLLGSLIVTGLYGLKTRGRSLFSASAAPRWEHVVLLVLVALFFRLPAYHYVLGGQDEGLYTNIAQHVDYTGGIALRDVVAEKLAGSTSLDQYLQDNRLAGYPGLYLAGVYARSAGDTKLEFQFYDIFPVWIALFSGAFGPLSGVYALTFFSILSIVFFYRLALLLTRSHSASLMAGGLLALNPLHAFFSKFPVTEIPALAFSLIGFVLLVSYWKEALVVRRRQWMYLSILAFLCLFTTRISGFMYLPLFIIMAMAALIYEFHSARRRSVQIWAVGTMLVYLISVVYGLVYSQSYSHDIYNASFAPIFGDHWKIIVVALVCLGLLLWTVCVALTKQPYWREQMAIWILHPVNRWLGIVVFAALVLGGLRVYWLGWTDHYTGSSLDLYWHLSGLRWRSASSSSLWTLCIFLGPPMVLSFLALIGRKATEPCMGFLRFFLVGFFVFGIALQWDVPYSPYYARYLLSELAPYLILFVVCAWAAMRAGRPKAILSAMLVFSLVYSTAISAMQIGKNENDGAYTALARLVAPVDPDDVILLDTLQQPPDTSLIKTPLVYMFHREVITVGEKGLSNHAYLAKLGSLYNDVFLVSPGPAAPGGFTKLDSVRFQPLTYVHNHSFPHKLVPQTNVVLYLYRLDNPLVPLGHALSFAKGQPWGNWLRAGWSAPESWGVWSNANRAVLTIDPAQLPADAKGLVFHIDAQVYVKPSNPRQRVEVSVNGKSVVSYRVTYPTFKLSMTLPVASSEWADTHKLQIEFTLPDATSPKAIGESGDTRELALGLISLTAMEERSKPSITTEKPTESRPAIQQH
jgi:hypothetical protein